MCTLCTALNPALLGHHWDCSFAVGGDISSASTSPTFLTARPKRHLSVTGEFRRQLNRTFFQVLPECQEAFNILILRQAAIL